MEMQEILTFLESRQEELYAASDYIWDCAETAFREVKSSARLREILEKEGFTVKKGVAGMPTAFTASYGQGAPVIGILGEYDALPDMSQKAGIDKPEPVKKGRPGHGCGHNLLGVGSLAGALCVKEYLSTHPNSGTVIYFGCPGEEGGGGKVFMVRKGLFDKVDCVLTWHPSFFNIAVAGSSLANIRKVYTFKGRAAHAAGSPHEGRSALDAAELMNVGANYLREHIIPEARIHYAFLNAGGTAPNVVQSLAEEIYLIRAPKIEEVREITLRVDDIAKGAALMTGTVMEERFEKAYSNTVPNDPLLNLVKQTLMEAVKLPVTREEMDFAGRIASTIPNGKQALLREISKVKNEKIQGAIAAFGDLPYFGSIPGMPITTPGGVRSASTDVGDVSWVCPTVQFAGATWAAGTPGHSWQVVAQGKSGYAHKNMLFAGEVIGAAAIRLLQDPDLIAAAKADHQKKLAGRKYICPIPPEVKPHPPLTTPEG